LDRRSVLEVVFSGALISPCFAQPRQLRRIGFLSESSPDAGNVLLHEFENALWALGYIEGGNLVLERRFSGGFPERSTAQARELVASQVDVLVASGNAATAAAMKATSTLPIVMLNTVEPVRSGFVLSLAKPGRNVTGVTQDASDSRATKLLQLIRQLTPSATAIAWLRSAELGAASPSQTREATTKAAEVLGLKLELIELRTIDDLGPAFDRMAQLRVDAFFEGTTGFSYTRPQDFAQLALRHRLPGFTFTADVARAGLLAPYGPDYAYVYKRGAYYVDRILKGVKAEDLPIELPAKYLFVLNLRTARALGVSVPRSTLIQADEVIE